MKISIAHYAHLQLGHNALRKKMVSNCTTLHIKTLTYTNTAPKHYANVDLTKNYSTIVGEEILMI